MKVIVVFDGKEIPTSIIFSRNLFKGYYTMGVKVGDSPVETCNVTYRREQVAKAVKAARNGSGVSMVKLVKG